MVGNNVMGKGAGMLSTAAGPNPWTPTAPPDYDQKQGQITPAVPPPTAPPDYGQPLTPPTTLVHQDFGQTPMGGQTTTGGGTTTGGVTTAAPYGTVSELYKGVLGRDGEQAGMDYWTGVFGDSVDADEYQKFLTATRPEMSNQVNQVYRDSFGRESDDAGRAYWQGQVNEGAFDSMANMRKTITDGRLGYDKSAYEDGAKYDTAWDKSLNANDSQLVYNAEADRWEIKKRTVGGGGGEAVTYKPNLNQEVDAKTMTIEGRLNNVLGTDAKGEYTNPVVRQAVGRAMQQLAGRGLLNSSMAMQAAQEAAIAKAIEIVGPDAERYFAQSGKNQDAQNVFARDEQQNKYDLNRMKVAHGYDLERMGSQQGYDLEKMGSQYGWDISRLNEQQRIDLERLSVVNGYETTAKGREYDFVGSQNDKDRLNRLEVAGISRADNQDDRLFRLEADRLNREATQGNQRAQVVSNAYGNLMENELKILAMDLDAKAKVRMLNQMSESFNRLALSNGSTLTGKTYTEKDVEDSKGGDK